MQWLREDGDAGAFPGAGVFKIEVDLASARAVVASGARTEDLVGAVEAAGYGAQLLNQDAAGV